MLHRDHYLTKPLVLEYPKKVYHNGVKHTLTEFRSEFWINPQGNYVQKVIEWLFHLQKITVT